MKIPAQAPTELTEDELRAKAKALMAKITTPFWTGFCPECAMQGKSVRMRLNDDDSFECEESGLQICAVPGFQATILNFRGKGKFRSTPTYADESHPDEILCPQTMDRPPFAHAFEEFSDKQAMAEYIERIIILKNGEIAALNSENGRKDT